MPIRLTVEADADRLRDVGQPGRDRLFRQVRSFLSPAGAPGESVAASVEGLALVQLADGCLDPPAYFRVPVSPAALSSRARPRRLS